MNSKLTHHNRHKVVKIQKFETRMFEESKPDTLLNDFNLLLKCLLLAGLVFPPLNSKKRRSSWYTKLFELSYNLLAIIIIIINILFWQRRYSSVTLHFSTSLTLLLAISLRFVLCLCRKKIPYMAKHLVQLYDDINFGRYHKSLRVYIGIGCFLTILLSTVTSFLDCYHLETEHAKQQRSIQFMFALDGNGYQTWIHYVFMILAPIKMYFAYGVSVIIFTFCCFVYAVARRIVILLDQHIQIQDGFTITNLTINNYLNIFNRLCRVIAEIDEVLSPCVLLLYGLMVSAQFYALTVLISSDTEPRSLITALQNVIVFLLTTVAFLMVTLVASNITEKTEDIKRSLHKLADNANGNIILTDRIISNSYLVLISILGGSQLCFTGWRMFNINRSFILTTMGVMISYGVIIVQLGRKNSIA